MEAILSRTQENQRNLELQIRNLLQTMTVEDKLEEVPLLHLPQPKPLNNDEKPEVRMEWNRESNPAKRHKKGKSVGESSRESNRSEKLLSPLDEMQRQVEEDITKYKIDDESVFFVHVLDRCIFGMTLINLANQNLRTPTVSISLLQLNPHTKTSPESFERVSPFFYSVHTDVKDVTVDKGSNIKAKSSEVHFQDSFVHCNGEPGEGIVMPGCEVLISANFRYPSGDFQNSNVFSLLVSVVLEGSQLWSRRIEIKSVHFEAANIDSTFKKHHFDILTSLGDVRQSFKVERILSYDTGSIKTAIEKYLFPLGFERIGTQKTGIDKQIDVYTSNQPSLYWGAQWKIESCTKKISVVRCLVTARTDDQMNLLFSSFKTWLLKEIQRERKGQTGNGPKVSNILPMPNLNIVSKIESEIELIVKLNQAKNVLSQVRRESQSETTGGSIDSNWIHEYTSCVAKTDQMLVEKMGK